MISAFIPVSDSFVVAGTSESQIQVVQFPNADESSDFRAEHGTHTQQQLSLSTSVTRPVSTTTLGKCSHWPVSGVAYSGEIVAAASASTLSTWDLVKNRRVRHLTTPDYSTTCNFVGTRLLAVAGHGRSVHLYDPRVSSSSVPVWTATLAKDNFYTSAVDDCTVFAGGADGCIYSVDLRAQSKCRWDLQPDPQNRGDITEDDVGEKKDHVQKSSNAILDLKVADGDLVCTLESGQLCGVPRQFSDKEPEYRQSRNRFNTGDLEKNIVPKKAEAVTCQGGNYLFSTSYSRAPVRTKIGCDVLSVEGCSHIAVGSESGSVGYYNYDKKTGCNLVQTIEVGTGADTVPCVQWAPRGLYYSTGSTLGLLPYSGTM